MSEARPDGLGPPRRLRCEYLDDPLGIEEPRPRLSWQVSDDRRGATQSAYRVIVADSEDALDAEAELAWDSGRVESSRSVHVEYGGPDLPSRARRFWKVRTWDADGRPSPWSDAHWWEMGLLDPDDWSASWVAGASGREPAPPAHLRKEFALGGRVRRARIYATALGLYTLRLNGRPVGDHVFAPGWTDYRGRVMYQTYDVTGMLRDGPNALGATVAEGWYCGPLGWKQQRENFGPAPPRIVVQLEVELEGGGTERIVTDGSWRCSAGPILRAEFYNGERYDARQEMPGWDAPGFDDAGWGAVGVFDDPGVARTAQQDPPIRVTGELRPVSVAEPAPGCHVFDMGQNMVGCCRLRVSGPVGAEVRLRHAEFLNADGTVYTENLRTAEATDTYTLKGGGEETWAPAFTYHGFRYVEVTGLPGRPDPDALTGLVLHTDCEPTGRLETSSELVNRLQENIVWGQRGNMHSVLTDCPQRDERMGWLGDAQIFARTACANMDMAAMLTKFVRDVTDAQRPDGAVPDVVPYLSPGGVLPPAGAPAWMDAIVYLPWTTYLCYGDRRILERAFEPIVRYLDYVTAENPAGLWENARGNDYGDWVPAGEQTDKAMFATLHYFRSADLARRIAHVLGAEEEERLAGLAGRVRSAFNGRYLKDGRYENATQTVDALALAFGIVPEEARRSVADDLVGNVGGRDGHVSTGFSGAQWLLPALCETGHAELALRLLLNRDYPSWGYMIDKGATTIWERWNSDTEGPGMNSRNHFAYGSVGEWLFRYLAGIDTAEEEPGYRRVVVRPHPGRPGGELERVEATYESLRGPIRAGWRVTPAAFDLRVEIPANCRATVHVPAGSAEAVTEGSLPLAEAPGVEEVRAERGRVVCEIGAGSYRFEVARA